MYITPQGRHSTTWSLPPLDGTLSIPQLYEYHSEHSSLHPLFVYERDGIVHYINWAEGHATICRMARIISAHIKPGSQSVVGILTNHDALTYGILILGIMYSGNIPFPISPRNTAPMVAHLLKETATSYVFVGNDPANRSLLKDSIDLLNGSSITSIDMPMYDEVSYDDAGATIIQEQWSISQIELDQTALILHSSGSLALPRPVSLTHRGILLSAGMIPWWGEIDICGDIIALHSVPMFHSSGAVQLCWAATTGVALSSLAPTLRGSSPTFATPTVVFDAMVKTGCSIVYGVSVHIEEWAKDPEKIAYLKSLRALIYQGAPLSPQTGRKLVEDGVAVFPVYGSTEGGAISCMVPDRNREHDFEWFSISSQCDPYFIPEDQPRLFELVLMNCPKHLLPVTNIVINGREGYATTDLLIQHPQKPHLWKIYGRKDDQVTLTSGEKVNPIPLEMILMKDPSIRGALIFGRAKFYIGVLLDPVEPFDSSDETQLTTFRDAIWPTVIKMNQFAPNHGRLSKDMILVSTKDKLFEYNVKGFPKRQSTLSSYEFEIETAYKKTSESSQTDIKPPKRWDYSDIEFFITKVITRIMDQPIEPDIDLFAHGCDSLQAKWIENSVRHALSKNYKDLSAQLPDDILYRYPTIRALSQFLADSVSRFRSGEVTINMESDGETQNMLTVVEQKVHALATVDLQQINRDDSPYESIVVTGTTGALGSYLLEELLINDGVGKIYALNRHSSSRTLLERQQAAFKDHNIDIGLLNSQKLVLLEVDLVFPCLGLPNDVYEEILHSVTHIIHNAWPVDFRYTLSLFNNPLDGLVGLLRLCLQIPVVHRPKFVFVSSVSVFRNYSRIDPFPEVEIKDLSLAQGLGYAESKLVAESIIERVAALNSLNWTTVRISQLSGGRNGSWNVKEWFPVMVRSSLNSGCFPVFQESVVWLPVHVAALALFQARNVSATYIHLAHPRATSWITLAEVVAREIKVELVDYDQWIERLFGNNSEDKTHHAVRLLQAYRASGGDRETPRIRVRKALAVASTMETSNLPQLGEDDVMLWLGYWRRSGYIA